MMGMWWRTLTPGLEEGECEYGTLVPVVLTLPESKAMQNRAVARVLGTGLSRIAWV
ncbi:MAG: hypothetical protein PHF64_04030 [Methanoregula sp.]|nr:hypothetical protein [Methanoregula sp.]